MKEEIKDKTKWYKNKNKDVVIYYLIAIFFVEIIVTTIAFFYGVVHAEYQYTGGPRIASFPWLGWIIASSLVPVVLLLFFHLSGWFFSKTIDEPYEGDKSRSAQNIPDKVKVFYALVNNAPVILVLLTLLAFGILIFFIDSALATITPYIPWIVGGMSIFLTVSYLARLFFLSHENKLNREYEYRMQIFKETGIIITDKNTMQIDSSTQSKKSIPQQTILELPEETWRNDQPSDEKTNRDEES